MYPPSIDRLIQAVSQAGRSPAAEARRLRGLGSAVTDDGPTLPLIGVRGFAMMFFRTLTVALLLWGLSLAPAGWAAEFFATDFGGPSLDSHLQDEGEPANFEISAGSTLPGNVIHRAGMPAGLDREYITTVDDDYISTDFVYEITLNNSDENVSGISFFGVGSGNKVLFSNWPATAMYWLFQSDAVKFGYKDGDTEELLVLPIAAEEGPYRARITKLGDQLYFQLDEGNDGTFDYEPETAIDLSDEQYEFLNEPGNSRLFFGTDKEQREFDDMSVARMGDLYDLNDSNGVLDDNDVAAWIKALTDPARYADEFPNVSLIGRGDLDHNGVFDLADLQRFEEMLAESAATVAAPEPAGASLLFAGWAMLLSGLAGRRRRQRCALR